MFGTAGEILYFKFLHYRCYFSSLFQIDSRCAYVSKAKSLEKELSFDNNFLAPWKTVFDKHRISNNMD